MWEMVTRFFPQRNCTPLHERTGISAWLYKQRRVFPFSNEGIIISRIKYYNWYQGNQTQNKKHNSSFWKDLSGLGTEFEFAKTWNHTNEIDDGSVLPKHNFPLIFEFCSLKWINYRSKWRKINVIETWNASNRSIRLVYLPTFFWYVHSSCEFQTQEMVT